jgi:hypothetical protein
LKKSVLYIFIVALVGCLFVNYSLYRLYEYGVWHPFNSKAIIEGAGGKGHTLERFHDWQNRRKAEIVIMGSSHAYRAWNTAFLENQGLQAFNWGSSSQSPLNSYYLLKMLKPWDKGCRILILDVFPPLLSEQQGVESALDLNTNLPLKLELFVMAYKTSGILALNHWFATAIDRMFRPYTSLEQKKQQEDVYIRGGYVKSAIPATSQSEPPEEWNNGWSLSLQQLDYLKACIELLQKHEVQTILICQPQQTSMTEMQAYNESIEQLSNMASELKTPFFNYSELSQDLPLKFFDWHHLDSSSVNHYNRYVLNDSSFLAALHN